MQRHTLHWAEIGLVRHKERWPLPPVDVREAVINALAHADCAQRGVWTLRDRLTSRVFQACGLIAQWGSGMKLTLQQLEARLCDQWGCEANVKTGANTTFHIRVESSEVA